MKLFITGGAGFIGSNFIRHILKRYPEYKVINFDKLTYAGNLENLKDIADSPNYKFIKGDICDKEAVASALQGADVIVNFAAESHVDRSIMDDNAFLKTDIFGVKILLEAVKQLGIKKMIQISTDEVYGDYESRGFAKEDSLLLPSSPYSASKAGGDLLSLAHHRTYGTPVVITRSSNNYGPYQYPEKIISLFVTNLLEGKKVPVYGDGEQIRDWLYVQDNCEAIDLVLHKGEPGEIYNIGACQNPEIDNLELTKKIIEACGKNESSIEYVKDRPGHDRRYAIDTEKMRALGWRPEISFEDGLKRTVEWYKNNREWWEKIKSGEYLDYYRKQYK
ncbi:dTDP-glucose 4,6-dehydratase [Candidatus Parcubacteria bacterium]|nr:dTDP-glucose 4,6-dehydratase [Candidatus Parcubacteria bacterium]